MNLLMMFAFIFAGAMEITSGFAVFFHTRLDDWFYQLNFYTPW